MTSVNDQPLPTARTDTSFAVACLTIATNSSTVLGWKKICGEALTFCAQFVKLLGMTGPVPDARLHVMLPDSRKSPGCPRLRRGREAQLRRLRKRRYIIDNTAGAA